jgi:hypothetical protein
MARSFNGTSDAIQIAVDLSSYNKISVSFWLKWTTFANDDKLAMEYSANYGANTGTFIIDPDSTAPVSGVFYWAWHYAGGGVTVAHFTRPSAGVWHQYVFLIDGSAAPSGAQLPAAYVDGVSQSLTYDSVAGLAGTFGNFTLNVMSRNKTSLFGAGSMADMAIWGGVLLTAGEASALGSGMRPGQIRPASLVCWTPFDGLASPEPDLSGNAKNGTLTGTSLASGPPVAMFTPRWPQFLASATFNPAWAMNRNFINAGVAT